jgi:nitrous oxide reductase
MNKQPKETSSERRAFLKTAGLGAGAAAAGVLGAVAPDAPPAAAAESINGADGYCETAHVKRFYDLAKTF